MVRLTSYRQGDTSLHYTIIHLLLKKHMPNQITYTCYTHLMYICTKCMMLFCGFGVRL